MSGHFAATARLPRSGNVALAAGALVQAAIGFEFVLAGLSKAVDVDFSTHFRSFVQASPGAKAGPLAPLMQSVVVPNAAIMAEIAKWTELVGGTILVLVAIEVLRRRLAGSLGTQHAYEPAVALVSAAAAFALGGMSLTIYLLQGARLPAVNAGFAFTSPIAIELFLVPLAFVIAWLEFARFRALK